MPEQCDPRPYDALLLLSFGGPEGPDDVVPFLENVTRGRGIPRERLKEVGQHYFLFGGVSPINAQNRELLDALRKDFAEHGLDLPVYWGNRNWAPYLTDTLRTMVRRRAPPHRRPGHQRLRLVLGLPAVPREPRRRRSPPCRPRGCRCRSVDKLRHYFNHPGFVAPMIDGVLASLAAPAPGGPGRRPPRLHHALHPHRRRRHLRPPVETPRRGRRLRRPAPGRGRG